MNLLIHNALIFTNDEKNTLLRDHAVAIEGNRICEIGPAAALRRKYAGHQMIDGGGRLLMPGLVNAHMHFYGTFARGLTLPGTPRNFHEILQMLWWKLDRALDGEAVYYSALLPALTAVRHGVTAIIDHHASPKATDGSLDRIEAALAQLGLRGLLCYEISDRDGADAALAGLRENERYIEKCRAAKERDPGHLYDAMMGLHASFTLEDRTLETAAETARRLERGCHIHVLEDAVDRTLTRQRYGAEIVERLQRFGILGERSIAAHGIYLSEAEMDLIAESGTIVVHNPQSNMNNAVGRADIFALLRRGVLLGLGTDGMSAGLWPDARCAALLHKHDLQNPGAGWTEIQQMVLKNNPAIYRRLTGQQVGQIKQDYLADLILIDYFPPTPIRGDNIWGHFLFGIADAPVDTSIINGNIVMQGRQIKGIDEAETAARAQEVAAKVWKLFAQ